jgi:hypothetical protein
MGALAAENIVYGREFSHILCDLDDCLYRIGESKAHPRSSRPRPRQAPSNAYCDSTCSVVAEVIPQSVAQNITRECTVLPAHDDEESSAPGQLVAFSTLDCL